MPIEPTNVSKTAVREVEQTSTGFGSWTSMQGSSTGGKDRPTSNSIWEKAITGAQKLFGSRTAEPRTIEDASEVEDSSESKAKSTPAEQTVESVPGFGSRGFGRFNASAFGGNAFGSIATSRATTDFSSENSIGTSLEKDLPKTDLGAKPKAKEEAKRSEVETVSKERPVVQEEEPEEDVSNEERSTVKAAGRSAAKTEGAQTQQPVAPLPAQAAATQVPQQQGVEPEATTVQAIAPAAAQAGGQAQPQTAQTPVAQTNQQSQAAPATQGTQNKAPQGQGTTQVAGAETVNTNANAVKPQKLETEAKVPGPVAQTKGQVVAEVAKQAQDVSKAVNTDAPKAATQVNSGPVAHETAKQPATVTPQTQGEAKPTVVGDSTATSSENSKSDSLGFDVAKAKEAISDTVARSAKQVAAKPMAQTNLQAQAPQAPAATDAASQASKPLAGDVSHARMGEGLESKEGPAGEPVKRDASQVAQQRATSARAATEAAGQSRSAATNGEGLAVDAKPAQTPSQASAANVSRDAAAAAASRMQSPVAANKPATANTANGTTTGLTGLTGSQGMTTAGTNAQGAQHGGSQNRDGGDPAAKQDFNSAMKQASNAKGGEKASGDAGQAFDAKVEAAANRRSEAASKASQTSYVSKTAAEVKETIATLTKSIDRLITDKSNAMNLKINFEGGGSVNLRISMDGSAVSTQMQTDVVGLESAIKANWAELANDWNQKGVKLNTPHFQNSESGKESSFENLNEFASKGDRQAAGRNGEGRGQNANRGSGARGFGQDASEGANVSSEESAQDEVVSDSKIKTYA